VRTMPVPQPDHTPERIEVHESLFRALVEDYPALQTMSVSKGVLVVASHLIEELAASAPDPSLLLSGFQHTRHWAAERDRYLQLSGETDVIAVFAGHESPPEWGTDHVGIRLATGNPLEQEWFVLSIGPTLAITLCGLDEATHAREPAPEGRVPGDESDRQFEVVWSMDPAVAKAAAEVVVKAIERDAPERAAEVRDRIAGMLPEPTPAQVAVTADQTVAGMLRRLEHLRSRERLADRRASAAKTEFLSRMSHELRTPLNAVLGFAQLLEQSDLAEDDADGVQQIARAGRHLLTLVDDLLDVAQIESGILPVSLEHVSVAEVVTEAVALATPAAAALGVTFDDAAASRTDVRAFADRRYAVQILVNLLTNAAKYDRSGAPVVVSVRSDGVEVDVAVRDHGPGIPMAAQAEIFAPFTRLSATEGGVRGTGLGLSISRAMAGATGGRIDVTSAPGEGSTFTLVLPGPWGPASVPAPSGPVA
jgi:signal transduction histidine kinase